MSKEISRRDFLKLMFYFTIALFLKDSFLNYSKIYPLYQLPYPPLNVNLPIDGLTPNLFPQIEATITNPNAAFKRVLHLNAQQDFSKSLKEKFNDYKLELSTNAYSIYKIKIPNPPQELQELCEPFLKVAIIENPQGILIPASSVQTKDRQILLSGMPQDILQYSNKQPHVALSIGATDPRLIAYQNIFSQPIPDKAAKDFSFPYGIYGLINLLTIGSPNNHEKKLLEIIKNQAFLEEYKHTNLLQMPFCDIFYQPQYGWTNSGGFFGSNDFNHFYDQTINLFGQGISQSKKPCGFIISGPWWFNQPNNEWAINLALKTLQNLGISPISILSADTGGQTGFYYQENSQYKFSHSGTCANMQHTTMALYGFS